MEIKELHSGLQYRVLKAAIPAGQRMPTHFASSDAFIVVAKGKAELIFSDREVLLEKGISFLIPANKLHTLQVTEDFEAVIVLAGEGKIEFAPVQAETLIDNSFAG
ncbi:MAG TPA: cupin domain-containing protein [Chitinophagaceae bacterium]